MKKNVIFLLMLFSMSVVQGQIKTIYNNTNLLYKLSPQTENLIYKINVSPLTTHKMLEEDKETEGSGIPFRFGRGIYVNIGLDDGVWSNVENGRVWTKIIEADGAKSLNFVFDNLFLPNGAELYITNRSQSVVYGPITYNNIGNNREFLSDIIPDSCAVFFLFEPDEAFGLSFITIKKIVYGYRNFKVNMQGGLVDSSEPCNNDVMCFPEYLNESKSVGLVLLASGEELCSGALIMTSDYSLKPYFLTAFHCIDSDRNGNLSSSEITDSQNWMFKFNYKKIYCGGDGLMESTTYNSSTFKAAFKDTDFALLELNQSLSNNNNLSWLGWDRTGTIPSNGYTIHHPKGDVQKISFEDNIFQSSSWNGNNNHWLVYFDDGVVEHGSSGAPLLNENNRIVGQLHGNQQYNSELSYCNQPRAEYGKFSMSWEGGGTNNTRLCNWLDPNGTNMLVIDGCSPFCISGVSNPFGTNIYNIQNLPEGFTVSWSFNRSSGATTGWTLQGNTPVANQCTFSYTTRVALSGTLTAELYRGGVLVRTIHKILEYTPMYMGTYYQNDNFHNTNPQNIPETAFYDGQHLTVIPKCNVYIDFDIPVGYGVYHSGDNLLEWTNNGQGSVVLRFPYRRTQWQYQTISGTYQNQSYEFYVDCRPDDSFIDEPILDLDYFGSDLTITLIKADVVESESSEKYLDSSDKAISGDNAWNLSIVNAITGRQVFGGRVNGESQRLSTVNWTKGIYVVKAQFDGQVLSQKIVIK